MPENVYQTWTRADFIQELVDQFLAGQLLFVPESLEQAIEDSKPALRVERKELTYLIWSTIRNTPREHRQSKFRRVHSESLRFQSSNSTVKTAIEWLIRQGFVELPEGKNSYSSGNYSKKYRLLSKPRPVAITLNDKSLLDGLRESDPKDAACNHTKQCIALLSVDKPGLSAELAGLLGNENAWKKTNSDDYATKKARWLYTFGRPLVMLCNGKGTGTRGKKGNRLYSPMTNLKKEFRRFFSFDGEPMVMLDMKAAQPCLLGNLADDAQLINDCCSDAFYGKIVAELGVSRAKAKKAYCTYAYGKEREEAPLSKLMEQNYPKSVGYISKGKREGYKQFSWQMQRVEAEIFVDQAYLAVRERGIPALTIHDGIFCKKSDAPQVKQEIEKAIESKKYRAKIETEE